MEKAKKILSISFRVLAWLLIAFTVFMMIFTIVTVNTVDKTDVSIFGYKFYIVKTDSMSPSEKNKDLDIHFNAGDIIIAKTPDDPRALKKGEVITFISDSSLSYHKTITHMIYSVKTDSKGKAVEYTTYGTNTGAIDEAPVPPDFVLGVYAGKLPGVGQFFQFIRSVPGYIICILIPFLLLILYNGVNVIRLFRKYKREQMEAMQAERDKIDAERAENQRMMEELLALKAQLANGGVVQPTAETVSDAESSEPQNTENGSDNN
jgi:signal peptidase